MNKEAGRKSTLVNKDEGRKSILLDIVAGGEGSLEATDKSEEAKTKKIEEV